MVNHKGLTGKVLNVLIKVIVKTAGSVERKIDQMRKPASVWTAPVTPEAIWFESRGDSLFVEFGIIDCFGLGGWDVADGFE